MDNATIGDGAGALYEFDWEDGPTRTSDEIGDLSVLDCNVSLSDIVELGRDDPECTVRIIGFGAS